MKRWGLILCMALMVGVLVSCGGAEYRLPELRIAIEGLGQSRRAPYYEITDGTTLRVTMAEFMNYDEKTGAWYPQKRGESREIALSTTERRDLFLALRQLQTYAPKDMKSILGDGSASRLVWVYIGCAKYPSLLAYTCREGNFASAGVDPNVMQLLNRCMSIGAFSDDPLWGPVFREVPKDW